MDDNYYEIEILASGHHYDVASKPGYLTSVMTFRANKQAVDDWYGATREQLLDEWRREMTVLLGWPSENYPYVVFVHVTGEIFTAALIEEVKTP